MSDDDYMLINKTARLYEFMRDKAGEKKGQHKESKHFLIVNNYPFIVEDLCGRVEAAQKKLEEAERERERQPNHSPTIPNSHQQENNDKIISGLEEESKQLRAKIKQLEQQLNNQQFSGNEKKIKESELDINRKLLEEREKELAKLRKSKPSQPTNTEKDNSKLN